MNSLISIIVPVYNVEPYITRCVNSILSQKYIFWEAILVDDGSPDRCPQICDEFARIDDRIKVIHKENGGLSSARNAALDIAKGEYVYFVDSDDFIHPDCLYDLLEIADHNCADIVQHTFVKGADSTFPRIVKRNKLRIYNNRNIFYSRNQKIIVWGKLYKRELWDGIRMPEGKINEDDATTWKLYYKSKKTVFVDTPYYYYAINPTSIMSGQKKVVRIDFVEHYKERINFFQGQGDKLLEDLSKWRFCLPLMSCYMMGNVRKDDLSILLNNFRECYKAAILCKKTRFEHRILLILFSICPSMYRKLFELIGRAHTLE